MALPVREPPMLLEDKGYGDMLFARTYSSIATTKLLKPSLAFRPS